MVEYRLTVCYDVSPELTSRRCTCHCLLDVRRYGTFHRCLTQTGPCEMSRTVAEDYCRGVVCSGVGSSRSSRVCRLKQYRGAQTC